MKFQIILFAQVVFLGSLCVGKLHSLPTNSLNAINTESNKFTGENLIWIYENQGTRKFMDSTGLANSVYRGYKFSFTQESTGTNHVSISSGSNTKLYMFISSINFQLSYTLMESGRTIFEIESVPGSKTKFYLKYKSNEGLVTLGGTGPLPFYIQSLYPNEKLAEFYLVPSTVEASYDGKLKNIITTVERIRNGDYGAESAAYTQLLAAMKRFNHNLESELFTVANYIKEDLGVTDGAFVELPTQVQLIVSGEPLALYYKQDATTEYTMKYEKADHYQDIFPYTFTYSKDSDSWAITNVGSAAEHQLYTRNVSPYTLSQRLSSEKEFVFKFKLGPGLEHINVLNERRNPLATNNFLPAFIFVEYSIREDCQFYVKRFTNELKVENSKMCASGQVQCSYE